MDLLFNPIVQSTPDTCKNCAKCGKGFKIGTNEAYNIKIKIRLGGISKIFCFCSHANMAASDKGISLKKFLKKFLLNITKPLERAHKTSQKRPWNNIDWMNRG